jgi:hypothetical protein
MTHDNPYVSPTEEPRCVKRASRASMLAKWITAVVGSLIVMAGALLAIVLVPAAFYPELYTSAIGLAALYVAGTLIAIVAGVLSFRATLRQYDSRRSGDSD